MSTPEKIAQNNIMLALGGRPDVRVWRQNTGVAWQGEVVRKSGGTVTLANPRPLRMGLAVGSADLIGLQRVTVTPDMVGMDIGVFLSVEVKAPTGRATAEQETWRRVVSMFGGRAGIVKTVEDAESILMRTQK